MAGHSDVIQLASYTAGADLSSDGGRVMQMQAAGTIIRATDGTVAGGQNLVGAIPLGGGNESGLATGVVVLGLVDLIVGDTFTRGTDDLATIDGAGRAVPWTAGSVCIGRWVSESLGNPTVGQTAKFIITHLGNNSGSVGGALGASDNRVVRTDGVGGVTVQGSGVTLSDADAMSGLTGLTLASGNVTLSGAGATVDGRDLDLMIEGGLGATDNIIVRVNGAGGLTVQGGGVATLSDAGVIGAATGLALGAAAPAASLIADFTSTTQAMAAPRMTVAQRDAIGAPVDGSLVYVTDATIDTYFQYANGAWVALIQGSTGASDNVILRADGTGGSTVQGGGVATLSDAGAIAGLTGMTLASGNIVLSGAGATVDGVDLDTAIRGALGASDNRIVRSDGAGGVTAQGSAIAVDDAGAMTGVTDITMTGTLAVTGSITVTGNVDGRDVSADGTLLDAFRRVTATNLGAGAAASPIDVTLNVVDINGNAVAAVTRIYVRADSPTADAITLTENGAGSAVATSAAAAAASIAIDTGANGDAIVRVAKAGAAGTAVFYACVAPASGVAVFGLPVSGDLNFA